MNVKPGDYAKALRCAMARAAGPMSARGLWRSIRAAGHECSYEHVRKLVAGKHNFSRAVNDAVCGALDLDADAMWQLSLFEKGVTKFGQVWSSILPPDDPAVRQAWPSLTDQDKKIIRAIVEGMSERHATGDDHEHVQLGPRLQPDGRPAVGRARSSP